MRPFWKLQDATVGQTAVHRTVPLHVVNASDTRCPDSVASDLGTDADAN